MNLNELFSIQAELDKRIIEEHNLQGEDLLDKKILSLQVELGELANEWRGFKFWSKDREPRTHKFKLVESETKHGQVVTPTPYNPLLEEYVDCLHFILSIGLELKLIKHKIRIDSDYTKETLTDTFSEMFFAISELKIDIKKYSAFAQKETYEALFNLFVGLGEMLGFTWEQIKQAYLDKNKINHERQLNGY